MSNKSSINKTDLLEVLGSPRESFTNSWDKTGKMFGQTEAGHFSCRYDPAKDEVSILLTGIDEETDGYVDNDIIEEAEVIAAIQGLRQVETVREPSAAAQALKPKFAQASDEV